MKETMKEETYYSGSSGEDPVSSGIAAQTNIRSGMALGDLVAEFTSFTGLDRLAGLYTDVTGKECGCSARQEALNKAFPGIPWTV
jgi:hypothetical protein